jgi:hypothetical protein
MNTSKAVAVGVNESPHHEQIIRFLRDRRTDWEAPNNLLIQE